MLNLVNLEEIHGVLLRAPELIREFEENEPGFLNSVKTWLARIETVLVNNRLPVAAAVAGLRGCLIAAERGAIPMGMVFSGKTNPRKIRNAAAAEVLRRAEEIISVAVRSDATRFSEGEKLMRQIVAVAERKGLKGAPTGNRTEVLRATWGLMSIDADLSAVATHLVGLIGSNDVLVLLDRCWPAAWK